MLEDQTIDAPPARVAAKRTNAVPRERASASTVIKNAEHEGRAVGATVADSRSMTALLPIMGVVLVAFLVIGLALPVLLLHVHQGLGAYTVFLDVALGLGSPALGILAGWKGLGSMFLVSAMVVLGTAGIAATLLPVSDPRTNDKTDRRSS